MNKKIIISIIIFLLIAGVAVFWSLQREEQVQQEQTQQEQQVEQKQENQNEEIGTSDWQTYRSEEYGFEIKYPERLNKNNDSNSQEIQSLLSPEERYFSVFFYPKPQDKKEKFLCGTALYIDVNDLPNPDMTLKDMLEAKDSYNGDLLPKYKFKNAEEVTLNEMKFLISDTTPYFLNAVTIKDGK